MASLRLFLDPETTRISANKFLLQYHVLHRLVLARGLPLQTDQTSEGGDARDALLPRTFTQADDEVVLGRYHDGPDGYVRRTRESLRSNIETHKDLDDRGLVLSFKYARESALEVSERLQTSCHELVLKVTSLRNQSLKTASFYTMGLIGTCLAISALDLLSAVPLLAGHDLLLWLCAAPIEGFILYPFLKKRWELSKSRTFSERVDTIVRAMVNREKISLDEIMKIGHSGGSLPGVEFGYLEDSTEERRL